MKGIYLRSLEAYADSVSLKGLTPTVIPDGLSMKKLYAPQSVYSRLLLDKPRPVLRNRYGLAVIDAAFPAPEDPDPQPDPDTIGSRVTRIISCSPGDGATTLIKALTAAIITGDTDLPDTLYRNGRQLAEYIPVLADGLTFTEGQSFDSQLYTMAQSVCDTQLTEEQFNRVINSGEKPLLFIDNCSKLPRRKLFSLLKALKDCSIKDFFIVLRPSDVHNDTVEDIFSRYDCRYEIAVDRLSARPEELVERFDVFNSGGQGDSLYGDGDSPEYSRVRRVKIQSVRKLMWDYSPGETTARFILQVFLRNSARPMNKFALNSLYFNTEFPSVCQGLYITAQEVAAIMPYIAAAIIKNRGGISRRQLEAAVAQRAECTGCGCDDVACITEDIAENSGLMENWGEVYNFRNSRFLNYFGAIALTDGKGCDIGDYLAEDFPNYNILTECIRYSYTKFATYPLAEAIIDYACRNMKEYADKYPDMMKRFDLVEEMPDNEDEFSLFGRHMHCLITAVKEFSPLIPREKADAIYSLIFRTHNSIPQMSAFFDPAQCWLNGFCKNNSRTFPLLRAKACIAELIKEGKDVYTELQRQIMAEKNEQRQILLTNALAIAVRTYDTSSILRLYNIHISAEFMAFLAGCEGEEYRRCRSVIKQVLKYSFYSEKLLLYAQKLADNPFDEKAQRFFAAAPLDRTTMDYSHNLDAGLRLKLYDIYEPRYRKRTDEQKAALYFRILALTGWWEAHHMIYSMNEAEERFPGRSKAWNVHPELTDEDWPMLFGQDVNTKDFFIRANFPFFVENIASNPGADFAEDALVDIPLNTATLTYHRGADKERCRKVHSIYLPLLEETADARTALRCFKILALTGRWDAEILAGKLEEINSRFCTDILFSWEGIGAETTPEELAMLRNPPAIITYSRIRQQLDNISAIKKTI